MSQKGSNYHPPCPVQKSHSTMHSLFFSGVVVAARLHMQQIQCAFPSSQMYPQQRIPTLPPFPRTLPHKWRYLFVKRYNTGSYYLEMRKINRYHCSPVVEHVFKDCLRALGIGARSKNETVFRNRHPQMEAPSCSTWASGKVNGDSA